MTMLYPNMLFEVIPLTYLSPQKGQGLDFDLIVHTGDVGVAVYKKNQARGYKTFFILNSAEHKIYLAHEC